MNSLLKELEKYLKPPIELKKGSQQGWTSTVFELRNSEGKYILKICKNSKDTNLVSFFLGGSY